jgi:prophage antirepressor-like protein
MKRQDQIDIYEIKGKKINVLIDENGAAHFCAGDILAVAGLKYQANVLKKLSCTETSNRNLNGSRRRFVSLSGLMALIPGKFLYVEARKAVVELILEYGPRDPGYRNLKCLN